MGGWVEGCLLALCFWFCFGGGGIYDGVDGRCQCFTLFNVIDFRLFSGRGRWWRACVLTVMDSSRWKNAGVPLAAGAGGGAARQGSARAGGLTVMGMNCCRDFCWWKRGVWIGKDSAGRTGGWRN